VLVLRWRYKWASARLACYSDVTAFGRWQAATPEPKRPAPRVTLLESTAAKLRWRAIGDDNARTGRIAATVGDTTYEVKPSKSGWQAVVKCGKTRGWPAASAGHPPDPAQGWWVGWFWLYGCGLVALLV
jgi:hypothetical protein